MLCLKHHCKTRLMNEACTHYWISGFAHNIHEECAEIVRDPRMQDPRNCGFYKAMKLSQGMLMVLTPTVFTVTLLTPTTVTLLIPTTVTLFTLTLAVPTVTLTVSTLSSLVIQSHADSDCADSRSAHSVNSLLLTASREGRISTAADVVSIRSGFIH